MSSVLTPKKNDELGERAEKALAYLEKRDLIHQTLHPGKEGKARAFLLFTDRFLESTLAYGAKHGALDQARLLDAATVAEMLLGPDDGTDAPRALNGAGLQAAILHRTDEPLARPQEVMAASGYIQVGGTLSAQKTRLVESLLAFTVREHIGTPPMTPLQWAKIYADLHPEILDDFGNRAFNAPTGEKLQIITQHLGVPGDHKFMVDEKRQIKLNNDELGNLEHFDVDKKKKSVFKKIIDVAVPVIGAALSLSGVGAGLGAAINVAYGVYKGAEAIKDGDFVGGLLGVASAIPLGGMAAEGAQMASDALKTIRAIESKDWMGALSGGLGTAGIAGGDQSFQTAAAGVDTADAIKEGDYLQAGAGLAGLAGEATAESGSRYAFEGLEQSLHVADGIQEKNYAGIGGAAAGLITIGGGYQQYRQD